MSDCGDVKKVFVASKVIEEPRPVVSGLDITPKAAEKIKLFLSQDGKPLNEFGLRIAVKKDGCSGFSYDMSLENLSVAKEAGDKCFEHEGANVMVEKTSYLFVIGSYLDYSEALTGSGFNLVNPNIKKTCSCGSSFSV
jgi:iron-sulfur cluster assembly protein